MLRLFNEIISNMLLYGISSGFSSVRLSCVEIERTLWKSKDSILSNKINARYIPYMERVECSRIE